MLKTLYVMERHVVKRDPHFYTLIYNLALLGATNAKMAAALGVSIKTIELWARTDSRFKAECQRGKDEADATVAASLFRCATGFDYYEEQVVTFQGRVTDVVSVKHHRPASAWAAARWLGLRQRGQWQNTDTVDIRTHTINTTLNIDLKDIPTTQLELLKRVLDSNKMLPGQDEPSFDDADSVD